MNEQSSGSRRRNIWIGSGIAMTAALIALAYTIDFPPGAQNVVGTIVPAQRFKAAQPAMDDIKAVTPSKLRQKGLDLLNNIRTYQPKDNEAPGAYFKK